MASHSLWLTELATVILNILIIVSVMANRDFCGNVFETQVSEYKLYYAIGKAVVEDEF